MATNTDIAKVIAMLQGTWSNFSPNKYTPEIFAQILGDLDQQLLNAATMQCISEARQFAPAPGEIRACAAKIQASASGIPDSLRAYREVLDMPSKRYHSWVEEENGKAYICQRYIEFSHPIVETVAHLMGWPTAFPTDNPTADRAQFMKAYDAEILRMMEKSARLPVVEKYIEQNKFALLEMQEATKRLEMK